MRSPGYLDNKLFTFVLSLWFRIVLLPLKKNGDGYTSNQQHQRYDSLCPSLLRNTCLTRQRTHLTLLIDKRKKLPQTFYHIVQTELNILSSILKKKEYILKQHNSIYLIIPLV